MRSSFVGRQPVLDEEGKIFAYELLFRSSDNGKDGAKDSMKATANVLLNAVNYIGLNKLINTKKAFITVDKDFLIGEVIDTIPKDRFVIEILETVIVDDYLCERIAALKADGYSFAIDDVNLDGRRLNDFESILPYVDIIKVDLLANADMEELQAKISQFVGLGIELLIENVGTMEEFEACKGIGFHYYQGNFFEKPTIVQGKKLEASTSNVVKILKMIHRNDALDEIAVEIGKSADLAINLLRYINSAVTGIRCEVSSIGQAVSLLGRLPLSHWLTLFLYAGTDENRFVDPLMESAVLRASIMSSFARKISKDKNISDKAYLTGLLSFFDAIMQIPLEKIKEEIAIDNEIYEAITTKQNILGNLINVASVMEKGDLAQIERIIKKIGMNMSELVDMLRECYASVDASRNNS